MSFSPIVVAVLKMFHEHMHVLTTWQTNSGSETDNDLQRDVIQTRNCSMLFEALRLAPSKGPTILDFLVCSCSAGFCVDNRVASLFLSTVASASVSVTFRQSCMVNEF
ncbi:hypothetical protein V6N11_006628 [Hibiscus sabdariffa]|uniref:Uncharacterized protein n=1 Tax=Hibiscus sabdariffa TaxID=183260 RepID=A0ABR2RRI5_9ROSI